MLLIWVLVFAGVLQEQELFDAFVTRVCGQEFALYVQLMVWDQKCYVVELLLGSRTTLLLWYYQPDMEDKTYKTETAADPTSLLPGSLGSWCHEHDTMHERLDIIEEKVIKTVEHLESEVKSLLSIISETTSDLPIAGGTPLIDIFDDAS